MPIVAVKGLSMSTGHDLCPPTIGITGDSLVFVNGRPVMRLGDLFAEHGCPDHPVHEQPIADASKLCFTNGIPIARVTDPIACGGEVATGDPLVDIHQ